MIIVGQIGKTKGVNGELKVKSFFSNPFDILIYSNFFFEDKKRLCIKFTKRNDEIFGKIKEIDTPEDAKEFAGRYIYINAKNLPNIGKNEFYYNDLENLEVYIKKKKIGKVKQINNHGAGDYLEIECSKEEILVPFNFDHILKIDVKEKKITLNHEYYDF
mgnify:CR=1 FL=1